MTFITYFLIHWGVMVILYKYNLPSLIAKLANQINVRFFHSLSECEFCIEHHVGIIVMGLFLPFVGIEWMYLIFPFMSASLMNIIKTKR